MSNAKIAADTAAPPKAPKVPKKSAPSAAKPERTPKVTAKAAPAIDAVAAPVTAAAKSKPKLVRDSFTIPKAEYAALESLKARATTLMRPAKKGELLRAGIKALHKMTDKAFLAAMNDVPSLKTGRPKALEADSPEPKPGK